MIRDITLLICGLLPPSRAKNRLLSCISGIEIAPTAVIRPCLLVRVKELKVGDRARFGAGTVVWNMLEVSVDDTATVGQWNWISSDPRLTGAYPIQQAGTFHLGRESAVTSRHHIDCSGGVAVGEFTIVAGHRTSILSHSVDIWDAVQRVSPVRIGRYCFVGAGCMITAGVAIADHVIVGAGSVVLQSLDEEYKLYAGAPASAKRDVRGAKYFSRSEGAVRPIPAES